jgi:tetratricopeptide (TPR) repeat protein
MTMPLLALGSTEILLIALGVFAVVAPTLALLWLIFGRGPRRKRAFARAQKALHKGDWEEALAGARVILEMGSMPASWEGRVRNLQGESHHVAGDAVLKEKRYEDALKHYSSAAELLEMGEGEYRTKVVESMLAESMRMFASGPTNNEKTQAILSRILSLAPNHPAASFWDGLCHVREGRLDLAQQAFSTSHESGNKAFLDPPLYLGVLQRRQGRPQDALRSLADANRIDANCPFVPLHMGIAIVEANGDAGLASRALLRGLGNRGVTQWLKTPQKAWSDGFPENKSHVRRLATKYEFDCPLIGDLTAQVNQARFALGQAHYRLGQFTEAAEVYARLLQDTPPTPAVLRAHGLALAKLERYDQAYKQLRIALEEAPKDHLTAGYLALCGALGKPQQEADRAKNVAWSIKLLSKYEVYGDAEYAELCSRVFAEARTLEMPVAAEDQVSLCDNLASVFATDRLAAAAYDYLAVSHPDSLRPEHAWIYCQAAHVNQITGARDLELFARTFQDAENAGQFFAQRGWDFDAVEFTYLERAAKARPGRFPMELGEGYADRGTSRLLARSKHLEDSGNRAGALAAAEVLLALSPQHTIAHDRAARLHFQSGELNRAAELLSGWALLEPKNHWPVVRRAVIEARRGNPAEAGAAIRQALELTSGPLRASIAYLGARLGLLGSSGEPAAAEAFLQQALADDPAHADALWLLAALRSTTGNREGLAALAPSMNRPDVPDPRFHYLAAVSALAAKDYPTVLEACRRAWAEPALTVECRYLMGWAHLHLGDEAGALREWEVVAKTEASPSAEHAKALLGRVRFGQGNYEEAIPWWSGVDTKRRGNWGLDEPLHGTVFLSALLALDNGKYAQAADRFREAAKLGSREKRLGGLLVLALVKAGQEKLFLGNGEARGQGNQ